MVVLFVLTQSPPCSFSLLIPLCFISKNTKSGDADCKICTGNTLEPTRCPERSAARLKYVTTLFQGSKRSPARGFSASWGICLFRRYWLDSSSPRVLSVAFAAGRTVSTFVICVRVSSCAAAQHLVCLCALLLLGTLFLLR